MLGTRIKTNLVSGGPLLMCLVAYLNSEPSLEAENNNNYHHRERESTRQEGMIAVAGQCWPCFEAADRPFRLDAP